MSTFGECAAWGAQELCASATPRLDAELLLCFAAGRTKSGLICALSDPVDEAAAGRYRGFIARRRAHEPVAYITGVKEFWGLAFSVSPAVLIPRPETELLVEKAAEFCRGLRGRPAVLDLGTGSGCIAVALAWELTRGRREFSITAVDRSVEALAQAGQNADRHGVLRHIEFKQSDWFSALAAARFHAVVCNPPYIRRDETDLSPELKFEPEAALFGGVRGTEAIEHLLARVADHLFPGGAFFCEIGAGQAGALSAGGGGRFRFHKDLAGVERVLELRV